MMSTSRTKKSAAAKKPTAAMRREWSEMLASLAGAPFRRSDLSARLYRHTQPRSRPDADGFAAVLVQESAAAGVITREGHVHWRGLPEKSPLAPPEAFATDLARGVLFDEALVRHVTSGSKSRRTGAIQMLQVLAALSPADLRAVIDWAATQKI